MVKLDKRKVDIMNQVIVMGRVTKDIELRNTQSGMATVRFNIAIDRGRDKEGNSRGADFPNIVAFGKTAESIAKFTGKGLRVAVIGRIQTGSYTNNEGQTVYTTDIVADRVKYIDWKGNGGQNENMSVPEGFQAITDDILPF